ncbi:uncharacterized protein LOC127094160 [Lathyrus oleraceus]|uniref:uncharacterized protein LOC127094160 n=1 Tax=Pisum sativum TaxID=3888 RepID=UPI0021CE17B1|nr:uncharacterized protein LOC127094160 [Pisum sativum]
MGYNYEIHYKSGKDNVVADALSRVTEPPIEEICAAISQNLIRKAQEDTKMRQHFSHKSDLLYFKDRLFIPEETGFRLEILQEFHASPLGGHSGIQASLARVSASFYWPAPIFISEIYKLHGAPKTIVSDRDRIFVSQFWRSLFKHLGTTLSFSSSYHPQTDGQTEVVNRCLETYLRCFVSDEPQLWVCFLSPTEFLYNTSFHSAKGMTPFEALYGRKPPTLVPYTTRKSKINTLDELLHNKARILRLLKENLTKAINPIVQQVNLHRKDKQFEVDKWVFLKLQPYRQSHVQHRPSQKLAKRYYGPFRIRRRIGPVAYELELPVSSRIHPVFHVSLLKLCHGQPVTQVSPLPDPIAFSPQELTPIAVLAHKPLHGEIKEVLIQWDDIPISEATWEQKSLFQAKYPHFNLEDKICVNGLGIREGELVGMLLGRSGEGVRGRTGHVDGEGTLDREREDGFKKGSGLRYENVSSLEFIKNVSFDTILVT